MFTLQLLSPPAVSSATMRNIFKRNQEPIVAPATTTATMPVRPADNSTESTGTGESQEDMFAKLKDKFFNEINKIPCEWSLWSVAWLGLRSGVRLGWVGLGWALSLGPSLDFSGNPIRHGLRVWSEINEDLSHGPSFSG